MRIETPAGALRVRVAQDKFFLTGPAAFVAEGIYHYE
jgi:diaminopimelate epimerase